MGLTKIKELVTGQARLEKRGSAIVPTAGGEADQTITHYDCAQDNQEIGHGWIAAAHDTRSSMTGGLMGSGRLLR
jgi:hypothetical protein